MARAGVAWVDEVEEVVLVAEANAEAEAAVAGVAEGAAAWASDGDAAWHTSRGSRRRGPPSSRLATSGRAQGRRRGTRWPSPGLMMMRPSQPPPPVAEGRSERGPRVVAATSRSSCARWRTRATEGRCRAQLTSGRGTSC